MPQDEPVNYRKQIAMGYKPKAMNQGGHVKKSAGTENFERRNYGNGVRKVSTKK